MLLLIVLSVLSVGMIGVSAVVSPYIAVVPETIEDVTMTPGTNFTVSICTDYVGTSEYLDYIWGYQFALSYNPSVINCVEVVNGDLIVGGSAKFMPGPFDNVAGELSLTVGVFKEGGEVTSGPGTLANVTFTVVGYGASTITIDSHSKLVGWNWFGDPYDYDIINAAEQPDQIQHGYFQNTAAVTRDIAVTSITSPSPVFAGELVNIGVNVENQGDVNEAFSVTVYNETDVIGTENVLNLIPAATTSLTFTWDTTGVPAGSYTINVTASTVPGEDTSDNTLDIEVEVIIPLHNPVAVITGSTADWIDKIQTFDGTGSYDPDGGEIILYEWDFDGDNVIDATGAIGNHIFTTAGSYDVKLIVTDSQNQKGATIHTILIKVPIAYGAALVKYQVRPERRCWKYPLDDDKNITITALAGNIGTNPNNVTITFIISDAKTGVPAGPVIVKDNILLAVGEENPVSIEIDPTDYGYDTEAPAKIVLYAYVTFECDSDGDGIPDTIASTKMVRIAVWP